MKKVDGYLEDSGCKNWEKEEFVDRGVYVILSKDYLDPLTDSVNRHIQDGYQPLGSPFYGSGLFCQAMLRSDDMQVLNFNASAGEDSK